MTMTKTPRHTPGPWMSPSAGIWTADKSCMIASCGGRDCVASRRAYARRVAGDEPGRTAAEISMMSADLDLIAASPDLLSACKALLSAGIEKGRADGTNIPAYLAQAWTAIHEAVEKAEGGGK